MNIYWPAFNMPTIVDSSVTKTISSQSHLCTLQYSKGAMLLQLNGKDGSDYYTLINKQGNSIVEPTLGEAIGTIGNGRFVVQVDGVYHVMNENGEEVFAELITQNPDIVSIESIGELHDGLCQINVWCEYSGQKYPTVIIADVNGNIVCRMGQTVVKEVTEVGN